jgi:hypothetical protein
LSEKETANPDRSPTGGSEKMIMLEEEEIRKKLVTEIEL